MSLWWSEGHLSLVFSLWQSEWKKTELLLTRPFYLCCLHSPLFTALTFSPGHERVIVVTRKTLKYELTRGECFKRFIYSICSSIFFTFFSFPGHVAGGAKIRGCWFKSLTFTSKIQVGKVKLPLSFAPPWSLSKGNNSPIFFLRHPNHACSSC